MTKSIKLNAANILSIKKKIDNDITNYSHIIREENIMSKKAIAAAASTACSIKAVLDTPILTEEGELTDASRQVTEQIEGIIYS